MTLTAADVIPMTQARSHLSDLADQVKAGAEKIITKNGESYVALIDARKLDYYHQLERERIHLVLIDDARRALAEIAAGQGIDADLAMHRMRAELAARRTSATGGGEAGRAEEGARRSAPVPRGKARRGR
ncbi:MAG TPA: type II toxin-antitoxin system Phd/YefM family antitoxin [Burkholderiaceae bacterium]|nr:type II toxin-antitoxin system Phd/YefM family antitoxin [Burkholderiaceae bacterium]